MTIHQSVVADDRTGYEGGGIFASFSDLAVNNTRFSGNVAGNPGQGNGLGRALHGRQE